MKAFAHLSFFACSGLATALFLLACQSQSEGEHCDSKNGDLDCATGLKCGLSNVCCLPNTPACNAAPTGPVTSDAAVDTATAPIDASTETGSPTGDARASDAPASDAPASDAPTSEASADGDAAKTPSADVGPDSSALTPDAASANAADGAHE